MSNHNNKRPQRFNHNQYHQDAWNYGHKREMEAIRFLTQFGDVRKSTRDEDIHDDIDCWLGDVPISVKSQDIALKTGNFGFELEMRRVSDGEWVGAWYQTGKAKYYVILVGDSIYQVSKARLVEYVCAHGWPQIKELSPRVKATQAGKRHDNYRNGLLPITTALREGIARKLR